VQFSSPFFWGVALCHGVTGDVRWPAESAVSFFRKLHRIQDVDAVKTEFQSCGVMSLGLSVIEHPCKASRTIITTQKQLNKLRVKDSDLIVHILHIL
jgi:hypothetical protein